MERINNNKWKVRLAVLAIFCLGFVAGAMSLNIYRSMRAGRAERETENRNRSFLDRLNLTTEQRTRVEQILKDSRQQMIEERRKSAPRMQEIRNQTNEQLQKVLTAEQWEQFQKIRSELRGRPPRNSRGERRNR